MSLANVTIGSEAPDLINVVVEIPRGTHHKYEYDPGMDAIKLDRVLHSPVFYPTEYGFIPQTESTDGDHLDALVIITDPLFPGCVLTVRPVGVLDMADDKGEDPKIVTIAATDPKLSQIQTIGDLDEHYRREIESFFRQYKELENKKVTVRSWLGKDAAVRLINDSMEVYRRKNS
jgi:inorganic pyrophosphatase